MSWVNWIIKFKNKKEVFIDWSEFITCVEKYGAIQASPGSSNSYELQMKEPIGECVLVYGSPASGVSSISINRPIANHYIRPFVFDVLSRFDMVLCDQNFSKGTSAKDLSGHIPKQILKEGIRVVQNEAELYI